MANDQKEPEKDIDMSSDDEDVEVEDGTCGACLQTFGNVDEDGVSHQVGVGTGYSLFTICST